MLFERTQAISGDAASMAAVTGRVKGLSQRTNATNVGFDAAQRRYGQQNKFQKSFRRISRMNRSGALLEGNGDVSMKKILIATATLRLCLVRQPGSFPQIRIALWKRARPEPQAR